ncbi:MAG: peptidylprolyl isomerase [Weeksellaceae bacterium]
MAILGQIRKQTGLLIVTIGIAMLAFVAGDVLSENSFIRRFFTGDPNEVGNIEGNSITISEFLNAQNSMRSGMNQSSNQTSEQVWNALLSEKIMQSHAQSAGLEVSEDEIWNHLARQYGMTNADELKHQIGQMKTQVQQGVPGMSQAYQNFMGMFEAAKPEILKKKYLDLINMGMVATNEEAKFQQAGNIQNASFEYGFASYDDLKARYDVEVTDSEIEAYIKKHPKSFEREAMVDLSYVYFVDKASQADEDAVLNSLKRHLTQTISYDSINNISDTIPSFANVRNDSAYVVKYSEMPFNSQFISRKDIEQFKTQLPEDYYNFLTTGSVGEVGGPFKVGETYQLVKISKTKDIADSIKSSHILISYRGTDVASRNEAITRNRDEARVLADSILNMVQTNPGNFNALVDQYSEDQGSKTQGGSIGWTSHNSRSIAAEYLQFLNTHTTGEIGLTESQFGYHIIRIDGVKNQTGYQFANIVKEIKPSQETSDNNFANARNFAQEIQGKSLNDFANLAQQKDYNYNTAENVTRYSLQPLFDPAFGIGNDKDDDILKWAFNKGTKPGDTELFTTVNEDQIIVFLSDKTSKGTASPKSVRDQVEPILVKQKLAQMINEKLGASPSVDAFVSNFGAERGSSTSNFGQAQITEKGPEPVVVGAAFGMEVGNTSKAIVGNQGIYVINLLTKTDPPTVEDAEFLIGNMTQQLKTQVNQRLVNSIIDASKVKDNRSKIMDRQIMQ